MLCGACLFSGAAFLLCYGLTALYEHHMYQLNSYKPAVQVKWLRRNFVRGYLFRHIFAVPAFFLAFWDSTLSTLLIAVLFVVQGYLNRPREAKKPLVYTPRVRRMLITHALLVVAAVCASLYSGVAGEAAFWALLLLCSPFVLLLSDFLNSPIEKAINRRYVNEAVRMLRDRPDLIVIGITGSYGKTSTKYFLQRLLSPRYNVLMTPESYNTTLGVVKTVRTQLKPLHEVFVCEMGARNVGDIREICDIVRPRYGVITSIGPQHLESFRTIGNIVATKFELADAIPEDGAVFLNGDNEHIRNRKFDGRAVFFSIEAESGAADYKARDIRVSESGSSFSVVLSGGEDRRFETRLIGRHNVQNLAGAIAVADFLGVGADDIAMAVRRLESVPHRLQLIRRGNIILIDDAYNSNESGAKAALEALAMFDGFKILLTPGMVELGAMEDECNRRFGQQAAAVCDSVVLVGEKRTASLYRGLQEAAYTMENVRVAEDLKQAFEAMERIDAGGRTKVVLLENDLPDNY